MASYTLSSIVMCVHCIAAVPFSMQSQLSHSHTIVTSPIPMQLYNMGEAIKVLYMYIVLITLSKGTKRFLLHWFC